MLNLFNLKCIDHLNPFLAKVALFVIRITSYNSMKAHLRLTFRATSGVKIAKAGTEQRQRLKKHNQGITYTKEKSPQPSEIRALQICTVRAAKGEPRNKRAALVFSPP